MSGYQNKRLCCCVRVHELDKELDESQLKITRLEIAGRDLIDFLAVLINDNKSPNKDQKERALEAIKIFWPVQRSNDHGQQRQ